MRQYPPPRGSITKAGYRRYRLKDRSQKFEHVIVWEQSPFVCGSFNSSGGHTGRRGQDSSYLDGAETSSHIREDSAGFLKVDDAAHNLPIRVQNQ